MKKFNKNFIFSTSTNSFQFEGGRTLGGRKQSIWDDFTIKNHHIPKPGSNKREIASIDVASDFYHRYKEDAEIMEDLGVNGFVYNLDWARIFPNNEKDINEEGIAWLEDMFKSMVDKNIKPIPIIYHWDTPIWLEKKGGVTGKYFLNAFRNFCKILYKKLGKYTDIWFVNDENSTFTTAAYLDDYLPPAKKDPREFWKALHNLHLSGAVAKEEFLLAKEKGYIKQDALIGIDHDWSPGIPYDESDKDDVISSKIFNKYNLNLFLDPNIKGQYPQLFYDELKKHNIENIVSNEDMEYLKKYTLDLIGWNYYRPSIIAHPKRANQDIPWKVTPSKFITNDALIVAPMTEKYTNWNWLIKPEYLVTGSKTLYNRYNKPLMIIENGIGYFDKKINGIVRDDYRIDFLHAHLQQVQIAISQGIPFIGYSLWTYADIFSPSGGYRKKYGLVEVDFENGTLDRTAKSSYYWYQEVIKNKTTSEKEFIDYNMYYEKALKDKNKW